MNGRHRGALAFVQIESKAKEMEGNPTLAPPPASLTFTRTSQKLSLCKGVGQMKFKGVGSLQVQRGVGKKQEDHQPECKQARKNHHSFPEGKEHSYGGELKGQYIKLHNHGRPLWGRTVETKDYKELSKQRRVGRRGRASQACAKAPRPAVHSSEGKSVEG